MTFFLLNSLNRLRFNDFDRLNHTLCAAVNGFVLLPLKCNGTLSVLILSFYFCVVMVLSPGSTSSVVGHVG